MGSRDVPVVTKIKLYNAVVGSLFTYECEGWNLSTKVMRKLNRVNSKLLAHFTGKTIREEARPVT